MKNYREVADELLDRRDKYFAMRTKRRKTMIRTAPALCCFCLAAALCIGVWQNGFFNQSSPRENLTNGIVQQEMLPKDESAPSPSMPLASTPSGKGGEDQDHGVAEPPKDHLSPEDVPEYYAGKYIDANGYNVVLLCADTTDNRKAICDWLGITESKTVFKTAAYSYAYLTELQQSIGKAMQNGSLPFVTASVLLDGKNRIEVSVTTNDEALLNTLMSYDKLGGAIDTKYSPNDALVDDALVLVPSPSPVCNQQQP